MNLGQALKQKSHRQFGLLVFVSSLLENDLMNLNKALESQLGGVDGHLTKMLLSHLGDEYFSLIKKPLIHNFQILKQEHNVSFDVYCQEILVDIEVQEFIFNQYPLLKGRLNNLSKRWLKNSIEIILALYNDTEDIRSQLLSDYQFEQIARIESGFGDNHRGGKSVKVVIMKNGKRLVYKPRSLSIDHHFSCLLAKFSENIKITFKAPKVIQKSNYGWVEFIEYDSCKSEQDVHDYYYKLGGLLAILYTLEATDFHFENIIAHGSQPVLIDLESFFHPYIPVEETNTNQGIDRSVLRTGILPKSFSLTENDDLDISGLADTEGKQGLLANQKIEFDESGNIQLNRIKGNFLSGKNIPTLNGEKMMVSTGYSQDMIDGFKEAYLYMMNHKDEFKKGVEKFKNDEVRVLFRNTVVYSHLLEESTHPMFLKSEQALFKHFDWLKAVIPSYNIAAYFVDYEIENLKQNDIPLFSTKANSKHLWYSDDQFIKDFFPKTGYETVIEKIDTLSDFDLQQQLWIIKASINLENKHFTSEKNKVSNVQIMPSNLGDLDTRLNKEVNSILSFIKANINDQNEKYANWLVLKAENIDGNKFFIAPAFYDLFSGMPGEILFLSHYGKTHKDPATLTLASKAYDYLCLHLEQSKSTIEPLGLYAGWGGIISMNTRLAELHQDDKYYQYIEDLFQKVNFEKLISKDTNYSLVKGSAGFIIACLNYYQNTASPKALTLAIKAAKHLIENQAPTNIGTGWRIVSKVPLTGMAHGASGFMLAFAKLYKVTGNTQYDEIVNKLMAFEHNLYSEEHKNWQDCRDIVTKEHGDNVFCSAAWSHGAGGIGLARLSLLKMGYNDQQIKDDLEIAIQTVIKGGFGNKHSLTYGDFGNLEFLLSYVEYTKNNTVRKSLNLQARKLMSSIDANGWNLGYGNVYSLGLMTGVTGIAYQCLRLLNPKEVPSVLVF